MNEILFLVERAPEGGYVARALGESIFTEADDLNDLHSHVRDAVRCHFAEGQAPRSGRICSKGKSPTEYKVAFVSGQTVAEGV